jgi:hypothetical protein
MIQLRGLFACSLWKANASEDSFEVGFAEESVVVAPEIIASVLGAQDIGALDG